MKNDDIVCYCSNVTRGQILSTLAQGAKNFEDVKSMTGACTVGRCKELSPKGRCCSADILEIIKQYNNEK